MDEARRRLSIQGLSRFRGGDYDEISISGIGTVQGAISVGRLSIQGIGRFRERAKIGTGTISGIGLFGNSLSVDKLTIDGVAKVRGNLKARELTAEGILRTSEDVACENLSVTGSWKCRGNVDATSVRLEGAIRLGGVLSADSMTILPDVVGHVRDVVADRITIRPSSLNRKSLWKIVSSILGIRPVLRARLIEGKDVELDAVHVERICGKRVKIGPRCVANTIEYSESIEIHPQATVGEVRKIAE